MTIRALALSLTVLAVGSAALAPPVAGQTDTSGSTSWTVPRTLDGHPDLQGVWANNSATPLERPDGLENKAALTQEEVADLQERARQLFNGETDAAFGDSVFQAALDDSQGFTSSDAGTGNYNQFWLVDREFESRTSLVVDPPDGRVPALTLDAQRRTDAGRAYRRDHPADSYTDRSNSDRCITYGVPRIRAGYNSYFQIFQAADHVAIYKELIHDVRVIPLGGRPHLDPSIRQWMGDSRAHWDGDTLVVETTNYSAQSNFMGSSDSFHLVERFTRVGPETLNWELTFTDPAQWTRPWTALISLKKSEDAIYEFACHEGNHAMEGILGGHRAQERTPAAEAK